MTRSKLKAIAEEEAEESQAMYEKEITKEMKEAEDKYINEPSYVPLLNLKMGRVSYGGMNSEVEAYMKDADPTLEDSKESDNEVSHDEEDDISRFCSQVKSVNKKFKNYTAKKFDGKEQKIQARGGENVTTSSFVATAIRKFNQIREAGQIRQTKFRNQVKRLK